jgi:hypothetical protein
MNHEDDLVAVVSAFPEVEGIVIDNGALTSSELAQKIGLSGSQTRCRLRKAVQAGKVERVWKYVIDSAGRHQRTPAYRPLKKEAKK